MSVPKLEIHHGLLANLVRPPETSVLVSEGIVVLLGDFVTSLQDHQATILRSVRQEVDEALHTAEARSFGVCKLVR